MENKDIRRTIKVSLENILVFCNIFKDHRRNKRRRGEVRVVTEIRERTSIQRRMGKFITKWRKQRIS